MLFTNIMLSGIIIDPCYNQSKLLSLKYFTGFITKCKFNEEKYYFLICLTASIKSHIVSIVLSIKSGGRCS